MTSHIDNTNPLFAGKSIPKSSYSFPGRRSWSSFSICMANLADTAMVGSIGPAATASVAINISSVWLINGFITALSAGFSYLVSHAIGEGNKTKVESAVRQSLIAAILLGFFPYTHSIFHPPKASCMAGSCPGSAPWSNCLHGYLFPGADRRNTGELSFLRSALCRKYPHPPLLLI